VLADARATAGYRREHHRFRSNLDAAVQVARLCWLTEAFFAQVCYRTGVALRTRGIPVLPTVLDHLSAVTGQVCIGDRVVVRPGLYLPHGQVVVDGLTVIGAEAVLRPFVTIGPNDGDPMGPTLDRGVSVGTGAKVLGPVAIGRDARIGANAVVLHDVPDGATAVGVPAMVRP
jgi:serine O-acetyltransferase